MIKRFLAAIALLLAGTAAMAGQITVTNTSTGNSVRFSATCNSIGDMTNAVQSWLNNGNQPPTGDGQPGAVYHVTYANVQNNGDGTETISQGSEDDGIYEEQDAQGADFTVANLGGASFTATRQPLQHPH